MNYNLIKLGTLSNKDKRDYSINWQLMVKKLNNTAYDKTTAQRLTNPIHHGRGCDVADARLCPHAIKQQRSSLKRVKSVFWSCHMAIKIGWEWENGPQGHLELFWSPGCFLGIHTQSRWHMCYHSLLSRVHGVSWDFFFSISFPQNCFLHLLGDEPVLFWFILFYCI